jgi:DNA-binding transcriptional regulator LsrR (DeoR family)
MWIRIELSYNHSILKICAIIKNSSLLREIMPRPNLSKDLRLVYKVSRLYYEQDVKEEEIASQLHLSRAKVSRLLKYARQTGVVQITVTSPPGIHTNLEQQIESKYSLEEVIVVEVDESQTQEAITRAIGNAAARIPG